jgi:hypothetical protein
MNILFNYNNFIFEKESSINDLLIDDMIELYKTEYIKDSYCDLIIMYDDNFCKFKTFLLNEIKNTIFVYIIKLTEQTANTELKQYFRNTLKNITKNISEFKISTKIFNNKDVDVINNKKIMQCYDKQYTNKIHILKFIWFMNDYDGEITFPNNQKIIPKKGKLILFPVSWCFSYEEINNISSEIITISGTFYKTE